MYNNSKGITPVIAIVLLLLVTVGAVGVVYQQFQGLVEDPDTDFLDDVEANIQVIQREGEDPGSMELRIQNSGEETLDLTDLTRLELSVSGEERLEHGAAVASFEELADTEGATQECFTEDADDDIKSLAPGETASCNTGIDMVDPSDETTVYMIESSSGEVVDSYTCSPATSESSTCS